MSLFTQIISPELTTAFAETIFHSVWQGFLILSLMWIILSIVNERHAKIRYAAAMLSLLTMFAASVVTFYYVYSPAEVKAQPNEVNIDGRTFQVIDLNKTNQKVQLNENYISEFIAESKAIVHDYGYEISVIWLFGILFLSARLLGGFVYLSRLKNRNAFNLPGEWSERIDTLKQKLGIKKNVSILQSDKVSSPMLIGIFKPVILIPLGMITGMSANHVETVITHELAHLKRYDYLLNVFQSVMEIIFFYHPAVWIISSSIREEREYCCDDMTINVCENSSLYVQALATLPEINRTVPVVTPAVKSRKQLYRRIERMIGKNRNFGLIKNKFAASLTTILLASTFVLYACAAGNERTVIKVKDDGDVVKITKKIHDEDEPESRIIIKSDDKFIDTGDLEDLGEIEIHMNDDWDIEIDDIDIDWSEFEHNMERLGRKLEKLDFHRKFNESEFEEKMEELSERLSNIKVNGFYSDRFARKMERLGDKIGRINIDFDMGKLELKLEELDHHLNNLDVDFDFDFDLDLNLEELHDNLAKIDFSELEEKLEELKEFVDELRSELYEDGYINDPDEEFDLDLGADDMWLNHERMPHEVHKKYLNMYEEHFGKKMDDDNRFRIN